MKRFLGLCLILSFLFLLCSCSSINSFNKNLSPEITQMRNICQLSTLKCYYHTVAKYNKQDIEGSLWWKKDRKFWIEYTGIVEIGIDASKLSIQSIEDNIVNIIIPSAEVLGCNPDENSLTKDSFVIDSNSAKITAEEQTEAYNEAQKNIKESAQKDRALLKNAQERAKEIITSYINNIGEVAGIQYQINWIDYSENAKDNVPTSNTQTSK